jgi:hypothetical protein
MEEEIPQGDGQYEQVRGEGVQPAELGYAPPDTGMGEGAESEIPVGVDALTDEQVQKAQENASAGGDEGGEGGAGDAIDVAAIMEQGGADVEGAAADDAGDDATEKTDAEAQVAPDTGGA